MLLSRQQGEGQNHGMKTSSRFFENVKKLEYFGTKVRNQI
jgi:hypothetical protein